MKKILLSILVVASLSASEYYYMNNGQKVYLTPQSLDGVQTRSSGSKLRLKDENGKEVVVNSRLLVKFNSTENLERYLSAYGLSVVKKFEIGGGIYLLQASSPMSAMSAANELYKKPDVEFAQPDIARKRVLR